MGEMLKAATHNGAFHPDDVFSAVVLQKLFPDIEIVRTRDPDVVEAADIVFDVGRVYDPSTLRFDHHQPGAPVRDNNIAYSAFGLLWLEYGTAFCNGDPEVAQAIDNRLVQVVDANDNGTQLSIPTVEGVKPFEIFDVLFQFNPLPESDEQYDKQYRQAVKIAKSILDRLVDTERAMIDVERYFNEQLSLSDDKRFVVLDKAADYKAIASNCTDLLYFMSPDTANGTWGVTAVSQPRDIFDLKRPFPAEWAGLGGNALAGLTGVPDALFCHLKRFYAVAASKDGALALLRQALGDDGDINGSVVKYNKGAAE